MAKLSKAKLRQECMTIAASLKNTMTELDLNKLELPKKRKHLKKFRRIVRAVNLYMVFNELASASTSDEGEQSKS